MEITLMELNEVIRVLAGDKTNEEKNKVRDMLIVKYGSTIKHVDLSELKKDIEDMREYNEWLKEIYIHYPQLSMAMLRQ